MPYIKAKQILGCAVLLSLSGCFFGGHYMQDEPIGIKRIEMIKPGKTTIREVLTQLGPPTAVARRGKAMVYPNTNGYSTQAEVFFELFSANRELYDYEVVYYYQAMHLRSSGFIFYLLLVNGGGWTDTNEAERLWLLVNEQTALVEDMVYRQ